jgi:hypothetical protein
MVLNKSLLAVLIAILVSLPAASWAQDGTPDIPEDELIVRLRPSPGAPRPAEVVDAVNQARSVPGGLGIGNPHRAALTREPPDPHGSLVSGVWGKFFFA